MPTKTVIQSLSRGLHLMEVLADAHDGMSLRHLAESLGVKSPTAHNLVQTLVMQGYAEQRPGSPRYFLGPAASRLATRADPDDLRRRLTEQMSQIQSEHPQLQVIFSEAIDGEVVPTLRLQPERPNYIDRQPGAPMNPYNAASPLVFQAFWSATTRSAYRRRYPFDVFAGPPWRDLEHLDRFLQQVRQLGYSRPPARGTPGSEHEFKVAVPIWDAQNRLYGVLGAYLYTEGVTTDEDTRQHLTQRLLQASHALCPVSSSS